MAKGGKILKDPPDFEPNPTPPIAGMSIGVQRSRSLRGYRDTNSLDRTGKPLQMSGRRRTREEFQSTDQSLAATDMNDFSVVAVYSREAYENFGKVWRSRMCPNSLQHVTQSSAKGVSEEDAESRLNLLSRSIIHTGFSDQVEALLRNKTIPHVIAVIEGKEEQSTLALSRNFSGKQTSLGYTRVSFSQGLTAGGANDDKQSMSFYVKNDMMNVYSFTQESIPIGSKAVRCVGINYQTVDNTWYRSLAVHIPNEFVGSDEQNSTTHKAFETYAKNAAKGAVPIVVTSYFGDTNYKKPIFSNTTPSMGGQLPGGATLRPQSSGAKKETNFMQSVPLRQDESQHVVLQPATLNYVFPDANAQERATTDHPSMLHFTAHKFDIAGRNSLYNSAYYA